MAKNKRNNYDDFDSLADQLLGDDKAAPASQPASAPSQQQPQNGDWWSKTKQLAGQAAKAWNESPIGKLNQYSVSQLPGGLMAQAVASAAAGAGKYSDEYERAKQLRDNNAKDIGPAGRAVGYTGAQLAQLPAYAALPGGAFRMGALGGALGSIGNYDKDITSQPPVQTANDLAVSGIAGGVAGGALGGALGTAGRAYGLAKNLVQNPEARSAAATALGKLPGFKTAGNIYDVFKTLGNLSKGAKAAATDGSSVGAAFKRESPAENLKRAAGSLNEAAPYVQDQDTDVGKLKELFDRINGKVQSGELNSQLGRGPITAEPIGYKGMNTDELRVRNSFLPPEGGGMPPGGSPGPKTSPGSPPNSGAAAAKTANTRSTFKVPVTSPRTSSVGPSTMTQASPPTPGKNWSMSADDLRQGMSPADFKNMVGKTSVSPGQFGTTQITPPGQGKTIASLLAPATFGGTALGMSNVSSAAGASQEAGGGQSPSVPRATDPVSTVAKTTAQRDPWMLNARDKAMTGGKLNLEPHEVSGQLYNNPQLVQKLALKGGQLGSAAQWVLDGLKQGHDAYASRLFTLQAQPWFRELVSGSPTTHQGTGQPSSLQQ